MQNEIKNNLSVQKSNTWQQAARYNFVQKSILWQTTGINLRWRFKQNEQAYGLFFPKHHPHSREQLFSERLMQAND
jgi:hypothetical protein